MKTLEMLSVVDDGSPACEELRDYARWLAGELGADTHAIAPDRVPTAGDGLVVAAGASAAARAVVERSAAPVLLTPHAPARRRPLWRAVVPLTGAPGADTALAFAVGFAQRAGMQVIAVHVADPHADAGSGLEGAAQYADAPHHEYPQQLEEFARRALPQCTLAERATLTELVLCRGDVIAELLTLVRERDADLLIAGWQGRLARPGSRLLERLSGALRCPLVIVKPVSHGPFRLNVGPALE